MKKEYKKPLINIDDFEVTERIAGACAENGAEIVTNFHDLICAWGPDGYFVDTPACEIRVGDDECLDTIAATEAYFWS